jgi:hypothetical protein
LLSSCRLLYRWVRGCPTAAAAAADAAGATQQQHGVS